MRIDAHQHFWNYDPVRDGWITDQMHVLRKNFLPEDLAPILRQNNMDGCVAVQADQSETETAFLLALAEQHDFMKGVVGWVDLLGNDLEKRLHYFTSFPRLKGFRHIVQSEPSGFLLNQKFCKGVSKLAEFNLTYDLLIYQDQLEEAASFVSEVDQVKIVVDHLAKPAILKNNFDYWKKHIIALSHFDHVYCKISGMVTEADWSAWKSSDFSPFLDVLFTCFGTSKLIFGSDWPVCLLAASYKDQLSIVEKYIEQFSADEKRKIMGENAVAFYHLD